MNDIVFQKDFVTQNAWRLISMQDMTPYSPSYGCFHLAYWRDKTSEFPDARFQEAGATLGLLTHSNFKQGNPDQWFPHFHAGLLNLNRQQYSEGCFDEWYKGERGFAATHFTVTAYGLAAYFLENSLSEETNKLLVKVMTKAGNWLLQRDDLVKTNHEAAACCALALIYHVTKESRFLAGAKDKLEKTLEVQTSEGWFPELSGADLGYSFLILDYIMLYIHVTGDESALPQMQKLFQFILPHIHPSYTVSAESGICMNSYMGRIGTILLSRHDEKASAIASALLKKTSNHEGLKPYLADDLRFTRWSHLALVAFLLQDQVKLSKERFCDVMPQGWSYHKQAKISAWHQKDSHIYCSLVSGGDVYAYVAGQKRIFDPAPYYIENDTTYIAKGYSPDNIVSNSSNRFEVTVPYAEARFFFPPFWQRIILRIGSVTATGSKAIRSLIDHIRIKKKSAVNQSSGSFKKGQNKFYLKRSIEVLQHMLIIEDRLTIPPSSKVRFFVKNNDIHKFVETNSSFIKKIYSLNDLHSEISYDADDNKRLNEAA